jgi:LysM repeat protein
LFGALFVPTRTEAGFLSSILGNQTYAEASTGMSPDNSQNIALLQANISSAVVFQEKGGSTTETIDPATDVNIVSDNALLPSASPLDDLGDTGGGDFSFDQMSVYVVHKGDTISQIAEMFDVSTNTILWANDMKKGDPLKEGDILLILPISGVKHIVQKGQTLNGIAKKYNAETFDIARFNGIAEDTALAVGDELIIPDGEMYVEGSPNKSTSTASKNTKTPTKDLSGYFVNPAPGAIRTQSLHGKNAVDLAAPIGTPIRAAASGTVLVARMGWNGGYGGVVIMQHPNGTQTLYSHLSGLNTSSGQKVSQGETIAYMGNTGHVRAAKGGTGSHVHFEVHGAKNPGTNGSWKR